MQIHWVNSRGEDRTAEVIAVFMHDEILHHVAFDPDFHQPRIFREIDAHVPADSSLPAFRWCEPIG
jgi:hypothetical protein